MVVLNLREIGVNSNLYWWTIKTLRRLGVKPSKRLGQSFTVNIRILEDFNSQCSDLYGSKCIEIGTGLGLVTYILSKCCRYVISIEKDHRLYTYSRDNLSKFKNIEVIHGDALELLKDLEPETVAGTIPYSITGPLLGSICSSSANKAIIVLQKDVVDRLSADEGSRRYGSITVLVKTFFNMNIVNIYPPKYFYPEPEVSSAMIKMVRTRDVFKNIDKYQRFLKCLFSYRRKMAKNALLRCCQKLEYSNTGFDIAKRIYQLSPIEILDLFNRCVD